MMGEVEAAEHVFAPDQRFLLLENGCSICFGVAQEAVALSSCGRKALVYSTSEEPVMYGMAYLPTRLQLPVQQLIRFRNRFIPRTGQRVVLNERYLRCEFHKNTFYEPAERVVTTAIVRRKRRCPFNRRVAMDVQYRFHPLSIVEKGNIDKIACTTVTHSMSVDSELAQFEVLDTLTYPAEQEADMSVIYAELEGCKDFLATYSRTRKPAYPWHLRTVVEVSNGTILMAGQDDEVEVWMRPRVDEEWGDVLVLQHGFVTCWTVDRNLTVLRSSDDTIIEEFEHRECALDTLLLGHGFGVSASTATAALARKMAEFQQSLSHHRASIQQPFTHQPLFSNASASAPLPVPARTEAKTCIREFSNVNGVFRAMGDGCVLARLRNRAVVRYEVANGVFRIVTSDGEEASSTAEHPYPLTREQVSALQWFASWGFKSDEEVDAMQQKLQAMSAMVHTAVQRSALFLAFLGKQHDSKQEQLSPVSVATGSPPHPPSWNAQNLVPSGKELTDLAARILEHNQQFLDAA